MLLWHTVFCPLSYILESGGKYFGRFFGHDDVTGIAAPLRVVAKLAKLAKLAKVFLRSDHLSVDQKTFLKVRISYDQLQKRREFSLCI